MSRVTDYLKERIPVDIDVLKDAGAEPVPGHLKRWWFAIGGTPAYLFIVQVATGILLTFYYIPNPAKAYDSVKYITEQLPFGWYIRSIHMWSSHLTIAAVILHMMRVFFTGAYRRPREFNWLVGCGLLGSMMMLGFTGYSLVYEQLSYWGATVAGNLTEASPVIGPILANFIRGGDAIGENTLTRFYIFHIAALPTLIVALICLHVMFIRLHGVAEMHFENETPEQKKTYPFFPDHFLTELSIGLVLMILLTVLACIFPARLDAKANPFVTPEHIKPEWYFLFSFRWLKLAGLSFAILSMGLFGFLIAAWPWIDGEWRSRRPGSEMSVWAGAVGAIALITLTVWEVIAKH